MSKVYNSQHFTPTKLAEFMISKVISNFSNCNNLEVLDPACGIGNLLNEASKYILSHNLYGWDVDKDVIKECNDLYNIELKEDSLMEGTLFNIYNGKKFDIVIMNPPYIQLSKIKKREYKVFDSYDARGDIYQLFIERSLDWIKEDGIVSCLVSNKWMRSDYGKVTRELLHKNAIVDWVLDLGGGNFNGVSVDICILQYRKRKEGEILQENIPSYIDLF